MNDVDDLARRFFALWTEYLTALVADPRAAEMLQRWIAFTSQFARPAGEHGAAPFPAWPPAALGFPGSGPAAVAPTVAGASGERGDAVGELARRVGELERRLAALERGPVARRPRRGSRASGE